MEYFLVRTPLEVMQRLRLDAETVVLFTSLKCSRSEFLSDFIIGGNKEKTEVLKPTETHTHTEETHKIIHQVWRATTSFYLISESGESRKRHTSPSALVLSALSKQSAGKKVSQGSRNGVFWHKCGLIHQRTYTFKTDTMTQDIQHVHRSAQIDPRVDHLHVSTQEIIIRKISEAQLLQCQDFVLHRDVIKLLIILLSPFF